MRGAVADGWLAPRRRRHGIGIREENLGRLFDELYREKRDETRELEGNGLGLSIVKRLVERSGGRLEAASVRGEGSVSACCCRRDAGRGGRGSPAVCPTVRPLRRHWSAPRW